MIAGVRTSAALVLLLCGAPAAWAQTNRPAPRPNRVTVSGGLLFMGSYGLGDPAAELRRNAVGPPSSVTFFRVESSLDSVAGVEARFAYAFTPRLSLEVGGSYARPQVTADIFQDQEAEGQPVATEKLSQYLVDVSGVFDLPRPMLGRHARTYLIAGGSYVRQLHEDRLLVETGRAIHAGGGVRYWLRGSAVTPRAFGIRGEARYVRRFGGVDFEDRSRGYPNLSALAFFAF